MSESFLEGLYVIGASRDFKIGKIYSYKLFGSELVIFRTQSGKLHAADPFCPHLGAHLGYGAIVRDTIVCPFHGWQFDSNGVCIKVPYCERIPRGAKIKTYRVIEKYGLALISWGNSDYLHLLTDYQDFCDNSLSRAKLLKFEVSAHFTNIVENAVDLAHFPRVHRYSTIPEVKQISFTDEKFELVLQTSKRILGKDSKMTVRVRYFGPGFSFIDILSQNFDMHIINAVSPITKKSCNQIFLYRFKLKSAPWLNFIVAPYIKQQLIQDFVGDLLIWNTKSTPKSPLLLKEDRYLPAVKNWLNSFSSCN